MYIIDNNGNVPNLNVTVSTLTFYILTACTRVPTSVTNFINFSNNNIIELKYYLYISINYKYYTVYL